MINIRDKNGNLEISANKKIGIGVAEKLIIFFQESKIQHFELPVSISGVVNYKIIDYKTFNEFLNIMRENFDCEII